jgi:hypothetical protein
MLWHHYAYGIKILENPICQYQAGITNWWYQPNTDINLLIFISKNINPCIQLLIN